MGDGSPMDRGSRPGSPRRVCGESGWWLLAALAAAMVGCRPASGPQTPTAARPPSLRLAGYTSGVCALVEGRELTCWRLGRRELERRFERPALDLEMDLETWCLVHADRTLECGGCRSPVADCEHDKIFTGPTWRVATPEPIDEVELGSFSACAVTADRRRVLCWGSNALGELGRVAPREGAQPPGVVELAPSAPISALELWGSGACALLDDGDLWCWGSLVRQTSSAPGRASLPGNGASDPLPRRILGDVRSLRVGPAFCVIQGPDRAVRCAGRNYAGQLGTPDLDLESRAFLDTGVRGARSLAMSASAVCALLETTHVECWGESMLPEGSPRAGVNRSPSSHVRLGPFPGAAHIEGARSGPLFCVTGGGRATTCFPRSEEARLIEAAAR